MCIVECHLASFWWYIHVVTFYFCFFLHCTQKYIENMDLFFICRYFVFLLHQLSLTLPQHIDQLKVELTTFICCEQILHDTHIMYIPRVCSCVDIDENTSMLRTIHIPLITCSHSQEWS